MTGAACGADHAYASGAPGDIFVGFMLVLFFLPFLSRSCSILFNFFVLVISCNLYIAMFLIYDFFPSISMIFLIIPATCCFDIFVCRFYLYIYITHDKFKKTN